MSAQQLKVPATVSAGSGLFGWGLQYAPQESVLARAWPWFWVAAAAIVLLVVVVAVRRHPLVRLGLLAAGVLGTGVWLQFAPTVTPGRDWWLWLTLAGGLALITTLAFGVHRQSGTAGTVGFWSWRSRRNKGVASGFQIWRHASKGALRRKAAQLRPSFRAWSLWRRRTVAAKELGTPLARVGMFRVWSSVEDVTLRVGGPRTGKTGELACRIVDAPGAVIATSTRTDLIQLTSACRKRLGPVHVFNPSGVGGLASTITFDPLSGCEVPKTALSRAADLLSGVSAPGRDGEREFWEGQARRGLAVLMHAAALGGRSMRDVQAWVADPDAARDLVVRLLRRSPEPSFESDAAQFLDTNERTRSSICSTIMPALGWLADPVAAAAAESGAFDVERLLTERGTVYMLGAEDAQTAPLVTALTGHVAREARRIAGHSLSGRLDPPLTLALDEAALICPIPLDNWTADMGGRGVTIHIAAQSRAQLRQRWGDTGAAAIMNNAATVLIFGGTRDPEDLNAYSTLTGERDEEVPNFDPGGTIVGRSMRRVPVLTAAQIAQLRERRVVIIRRGMPAAVGRVQMAWQRWEVKAAWRRERWARRLESLAGARERLGQLREAFADGLAARIEGWDTRFTPTLERWARNRTHAANLRRSGESDGWWTR